MPDWPDTPITGRMEVDFGDGASSSFVITHSLGVQYVSADIFNKSTGAWEQCTVVCNSTTQCTLSAESWVTTPPASNTLHAVIVGGAAGTTKVFRTVHTFALQGNVTVVTVPPFFVSLSAGQTINMVKARYVVGTGTNVTFKIQKNGADWTGYGTTGSPLTATTTAAETVQSNALADNDYITLVLVAISATPANMTVTCVLEHTV